MDFFIDYYDYGACIVISSIRKEKEVKMNAKKARVRRNKSEKLKRYMQECYELELKEWKQSEPRKIRFISHYLWKKRKPTIYSASDKQYKKHFKRL